MSLLSCNLRCQRRSIVGIIPSSAATSVCMRPLVSHSATASRLNSSVNRRFVVLVIIHLLAPRSLSSVSVKSREDQTNTRICISDLRYHRDHSFPVHIGRCELGRASCRERVCMYV